MFILVEGGLWTEDEKAVVKNLDKVMFDLSRFAVILGEDKIVLQDVEESVIGKDSFVFQYSSSDRAYEVYNKIVDAITNGEHLFRLPMV